MEYDVFTYGEEDTPTCPDCGTRIEPASQEDDGIACSLSGMPWLGICPNCGFSGKFAFEPEGDE